MGEVKAACGARQSTQAISSQPSGPALQLLQSVSGVPLRARPRQRLRGRVWRLSVACCWNGVLVQPKLVLVLRIRTGATRRQDQAPAVVKGHHHSCSLLAEKRKGKP